MSRSQINKAFYPSSKITDPKLFIGRRKEIIKLVDYIQEDGACIFIYGSRGVGKSSIAYQIKLIAEGDLNIPKFINIEKDLPEKGLHYLTTFITIDDSINDMYRLVQAIINGGNESESLFSFTNEGTRKVDAIKEKFKFSAKIFDFGTEFEREDTRTEKQLDDNTIDLFKQLLNIIKRENRQSNGLLIFIDEFDRLGNKNGIASLIKSCSDDFTKFIFSGIASNISELSSNHLSINRQLKAIKLHPMSNYEIDRILTRAEDYMDHIVSFEITARNAINSFSNGYPYYAHLIGKESALATYDENKIKVTINEVNACIEELTSGELNPIYEDLYIRAIYKKPKIELLLKLLSEEDIDEFNVEDIEGIAKDFEIEEVETLLNELIKIENSESILTVTKPEHYRFSDPFFRVYCKIRKLRYK